MQNADHVYDVEIPERISKDVMERFQGVKLANKPKKGKGAKGKKKKKWDYYHWLQLSLILF